MLIDIIIPHYKEDTKTVLTAVSSITNQVGYKSSIQITIVTDKGGVALDEPLITLSTNIPIKFMTTMVHMGPGNARQYAIDRTTGDYVMFCDSDDMLASPFVLKYFEDILKHSPNLEVIMTAYLEEIKTEEGFIYAQRDDDVSITTLHGKLYKRSFLEEHGIRFPNFMISEDGAFNFRCVCHAKYACFNDDVATYIWKYNPNSITRQNTSFPDADVNIRVFGESIIGFEQFFEEIITNKTSQVNTKIIKPFIESLFIRLDMIKTIPNLTEENLKDIENTDKKLKSLREKYKDYIYD